MPLQEYKDVIGATAGIFTVLQFFSPAILCAGIIKRGSSDGVDSMPFLGGFVISALFLQNALLIEDSTMIYVNILTTTMGVIYLTMYFLYSKEKVKFYIKLAKAGIFLAVIISYAQRENPEVVKFRFGLICTAVLLTVIAAPLFSFKEILRTRNTDALPMPIIISGTFVAFSWLLYGIAIDDVFVKLQNLVAFTLSILQIILYIICKLQKPPKKSSKKSKRN